MSIGEVAKFWRDTIPTHESEHKMLYYRTHDVFRKNDYFTKLGRTWWFTDPAAWGVPAFPKEPKAAAASAETVDENAEVAKSRKGS